MPTLGWRLEDDMDRYWERQPIVFRAATRRMVFACELCGLKFISPEERRTHLNLQHPLKLPALYLDGKLLPRNSIVRSIVDEDDVQFFNASRCEVQIDNLKWKEFTPAYLRSQISQVRNSTWNIRLIHERREDCSRSTEEYNLRFRIPSSAELNAIDAQFIQTLIVNELRHEDLNRFTRALPQNGPAHEYGGALGDYALGILLKERLQIRTASDDFAGFAGKMLSALEVLRHFPRLVALAVVSSIRFNLNDFSDHGLPTATELEDALQFFRSIANAGTEAKLVGSVASINQNGSARDVCPVDQVTFQLLSACSGLSNGGGLSLAHLEDLSQLTDGDHLVSEHDLAKTHVICAEGYLRIDRIADARRHLNEVRFHPKFKDWSQHRLEEIATYGTTNHQGCNFGSPCSM